MMDRKTLTALRESVRKWERIVAGTGKDNGTEDCALCQEFNLQVEDKCEGCPVAAKTGKPFCWNSPFVAWCKSSTLTLLGRVAKSKAAKVAAREELDFLRGLLPKSSRKPTAKRHGR